MNHGGKLERPKLEGQNYRGEIFATFGVVFSSACLTLRFWSLSRFSFRCLNSSFRRSFGKRSISCFSNFTSWNTIIIFVRGTYANLTQKWTLFASSKRNDNTLYHGVTQTDVWPQILIHPKLQPNKDLMFQPFRTFWTWFWQRKPLKKLLHNLQKLKCVCANHKKDNSSFFGTLNTTFWHFKYHCVVNAYLGNTNATFWWFKCQNYFIKLEIENAGAWCLNPSTFSA